MSDVELCRVINQLCPLLSRVSELSAAPVRCIHSLELGVVAPDRNWLADLLLGISISEAVGTLDEDCVRERMRGVIGAEAPCIYDPERRGWGAKSLSVIEAVVSGDTDMCEKLKLPVERRECRRLCEADLLGGLVVDIVLGGC